MIQFKYKNKLVTLREVNGVTIVLNYKNETMEIEGPINYALSLVFRAMPEYQAVK